MRGSRSFAPTTIESRRFIGRSRSTRNRRGPVLIYLDSAILIYALDDVGPLRARARAHLDAISAAGDRVAFSDLVRLECRVKPMETGDISRLAAFDAFFRRHDLTKLRITR